MREIKEPVILLMCPSMTSVDFDKLARKVKSHLTDWGWGKDKLKLYSLETIPQYFNLLAKNSQAPIIELHPSSKELYMRTGPIIYDNKYVIKIKNN